MDWRNNLTVLAPVGGMVRSTGYQSQPEFTSYDSENYWPLDPLSGRFISATRPSLEGFTIPNPTGLVNFIERVNGVRVGYPFESMVMAQAGQLYYWDGSAWVAATGSHAGLIGTTTAVHGATFLQKTYISQPGDKPIVFNYVDGTATELVESDGTVPNDLRFFAVFQGCLCGAGAINDGTIGPHVLAMSRVGDATDWNFAVPLTDQGGAFFTAGENEGLLRGPITALMPFTSDTMVVSTTEGLAALRGHPRQGGVFEDIGGDEVYTLGQGAWCKTSNNTLFMMTRLGLYMLLPEPGSVAMPVSPNKIPDELVGLSYDYADPTISMEFDQRWQGIHITVREKSGGSPAQAWFYHIQTGGFHKMTFADYPWRLREFFPIVTSNTSGVLYAGQDFLSRMDRLGAERFNSSITVGPVRIARSTHEKSIIDRAVVTFANETPTGEAVVEVAAGIDGEDAVQRLELDVPQFSATGITFANNNNTHYPKVSGHACAIRIKSDHGQLAFEEIALALKPAGANSAISTSDQVFRATCDGYCEATPQFLPDAQKSTGELLFFPSLGWIVIRSEARDTTFDGSVVTITEAASHGAPTAAFNGINIEITVDTVGPTTHGQIASAVNGLTGIEAYATAPADLYREGVDNTATTTLADGAVGAAIATPSMEMINLAALPAEWWDSTNADASNIRVTDADNNFIPFDIMGFDKTNKTGAMNISRPRPDPPVPVRLWTCDQFTAKFPPGGKYGQYNAYPPWYIRVSPSLPDRDRTRHTIEIPPFDFGGDDPFVPTSSDSKPENPPCQITANDRQMIFYGGIVRPKFIEDPPVGKEILMCGGDEIQTDAYVFLKLTDCAPPSATPQSYVLWVTDSDPTSGTLTNAVVGYSQGLIEQHGHAVTNSKFVDGQWYNFAIESWVGYIPGAPPSTWYMSWVGQKDIFNTGTLSNGPFDDVLQHRKTRVSPSVKKLPYKGASEYVPNLPRGFACSRIITDAQAEGYADVNAIVSASVRGFAAFSHSYTADETEETDAIEKIKEYKDWLRNYTPSGVSGDSGASANAEYWGSWSSYTASPSTPVGF